MVTIEEQAATRLSKINPRELDPPPRLIVNPHAGRKLGLPTNLSTLNAVQQALEDAGLHYEVRQTHAPKEATLLARQAVQEGCRLVIAAGGDGTVAETAEGLVNTNIALGIMPTGFALCTFRLRPCGSTGPTPPETRVGATWIWIRRFPIRPR